MQLRADLNRSLVLSVYIVTFVIGFPGNVFAFYIFIKKVMQKAKPIDVLLLSLTMSDLLFLFFLPFKMQEAVDNMEWNMPQFLCPLSRYVFFSTIYNSILTLSAISVERYLGVAYPIKYKTTFNKQSLYAVVASLFSWIISSAHASITYVMHYSSHPNRTIDQAEYCYEEFSPQQLAVLLPVRLEVFLILFCVPFLTCSFCYINLVRILSQKSNISTKKRFRRTIGLALATLVVFSICFVPYNLSHALGFAKWESIWWREIALLTSTLNACLDPLVIYFSSSTLRKASRVLLKTLSGRLERLLCPAKVLPCPNVSSSGHHRNTANSCV